jgi:hypothetical protein
MSRVSRPSILVPFGSAPAPTTPAARAVRSMRRLLLLIALLAAGLLGGPAMASASDVNLRTLVHDQRAYEKTIETKIEAASKRLGSPASRPQLNRRVSRYLRTCERLLGQARSSYNEYRKRFAAEGPETPESTRGRDLVMNGLKDGSHALAAQQRDFKRVATRIRRARTERGFDRALSALTGSTATRKLQERSESRLKRGRTLIRNAPAPAPPAA